MRSQGHISSGRCRSDRKRTSNTNWASQWRSFQEGNSYGWQSHVIGCFDCDTIVLTLYLGLLKSMSGGLCCSKGPTLPSIARGPCFRALHSQHVVHRLHRRAAAESPDAPSDDGNAIKGDWREFRASLINAEQNESAGTSGDLWSSRWTQENLRLLQEQVHRCNEGSEYCYKELTYAVAC